MSLEQLGKNATDGSVAPGLHQNVIQNVGATRQLLADESGSLCLLDSAGGIVYTLPVPVVGMRFEFLATVAVTASDVYTVITNDTAAVFLVGGVIMGDVTVATSGTYFEADGSTIVALTSNGSTAGGLLGERFQVTAISTTQWAIEGVCHGAGTLVTPFAIA